MHSKNRMYNDMFLPFDDFVSRAFGSDFDSDFDFFGSNMMGNSRKMISSGSNNNNNNRLDYDLPNNFIPSFVSNRFNDDFGGVSLGGKGNNGTFICKSYVSTTKLDKNGRPVKQEYSSQSIDQFTKDGKLSEKRSTYQDALNGIKKASHQRTINDQGHKIVKTKNYINNESNEDHYYKGINEDELNNFHNKFNDIGNKNKFFDSYKMLNDIKIKNKTPSNKYITSDNYINKKPELNNNLKNLNTNTKFRSNNELKSVRSNYIKNSGKEAMALGGVKNKVKFN